MSCRSASLLTLLVACGSNSPPAGPDAAEGCTAAAPGAPTERVATTGGVVHGTAVGATFAFLGVPFVAPPVGALRYAAPMPAACSPTELDATKLGPSCPQLDSNGVYGGDEDCLQLNVWAPSASAAPRPVMVWIHGGGNAAGTATDPMYDGHRIAEVGDVVVVTVNYRLGQLGFIDLPSLAAEAAQGSGNYGLLDQISALHWVHDNIASFGGDPGNVTIFGESAGARDVCSLVAAPGAAGLFHGALMESGSCRGLPTRATAQTTGASFATAVSCTGSDIPACLRALPAQTLINALPPDVSILTSTPYQPSIDGAVQTAQPSDVIAGGTHNHVRFLVGANSDETGKQVPPIMDANEYAMLVKNSYPSAYNQVLAQYPSSAYPTPRAAYVQLTTDSRFVCPSREIAKAMAANQTEQVFRYFFTFPGSGHFGAFHGLDVPYVFGNFDALIVNGNPYQATTADLAVSAAIQADWIGFTRAGAPGGSPSWPAWDSTDPSRVYSATPSVELAIRKAHCDFWQTFYDLPH